MNSSSSRFFSFLAWISREGPEGIIVEERAKSCEICLVYFSLPLCSVHADLMISFRFLLLLLKTGDCVAENDATNLTLDFTEEPKEKATCTADFTYKGYPVNVVSII